jgi:hypothetical protein
MKTTKNELHQKAMKQMTTFTSEGLSIQAESKKIWKLLTPYHNGKPMPKIDVSTRGIKFDNDGTAWRFSGGSAGYADITEHRVWLKCSPDWEVIAHELVHLAVTRNHDKVFYNALRDVTQRRFKVRISFFEVTRYGYDVDRIIERQLHDLGVFSKKGTK